MTVDSTLTFAARRNVPVRYDRNLVSTTIKAMDRVAEIRARREAVYHGKRMAGNREREDLANAKLVGSELKEQEKIALENKADVTLEDANMMEGTLEDELPVEKVKIKPKRRRLLVAGGDAEEMDMD